MPQDNNHKTTQDIKRNSTASHVYHNVIGVSGVVTLDRPHALNALNDEMVWSLNEIFTRWRNDPAVGHVVLSSSSSRAFCAGGDIRRVRDSILAGDFHAAEKFFRGEYLANLAIAEFGKPIIVLCDGLVMGGGAGLSQHSSHIIVTETTKFAMPESKIGLFPDVGASLFLGRCPVPVARLLGMTGHVIEGASCIMLGLANAMVPSQNIANLKQALIRCETDDIDKIINTKETALVKYDNKNNFTLIKFFRYILVIVITLISLIILLDTLKYPLNNYFPNLELLLFNFYESLKDVYLFTKDLIL